MNDPLQGVFHIAMAMLGLATLTLLIGQGPNTAKVIQSAGGTFNSLLQTLTLQSSFGSMNNGGVLGI